MNSSAHPSAQLNPAINTTTRHVFKLGLDVDLHFVVTAIQCDHGAIKPARKLTRAQLIS